MLNKTTTPAEDIRTTPFETLNMFIHLKHGSREFSVCQPSKEASHIGCIFSNLFLKENIHEINGKKIVANSYTDLN